MKLLEVYKQIAAYFNIAVDEEGQLQQRLKTKIKPLQIEGKPVYLPTKENLNTLDSERVIFFHPLKEFVDRGQSPVVARLRYVFNINLNVTIYELMVALGDIIDSPKLHSEFSPEQREMLLTVKEWSEDTTVKLTSFLGPLFASHPENVFLNIYLKKAGTYQGEKHARVGIATFEWYRRLQSEKLNKHCVAPFRTLMQFMFPDSQVEGTEEYNAASDSIYAPWLEALMRTAYKITSRINELIDLYADFLNPEDAARWRFDHDWVDAFDHLDAFKLELRLTPALKGNEGSTTETPSGDEQPTARPVVKPTTPPPATTRVVPERRVEREEVDTAYAQPPLPPQPTYPPGYPSYPPAPPAIDPRTGYPYPPQQPLPAPHQYTEDGKLNFDTVLASNPAVQAAAVAARVNSPWMAGQAPMVDPRLAPTGYPPPMPYYDPRLAPQPYAPMPPGIDPRTGYPYPPAPYDPRLAAPPAPGYYPPRPGGNIYPV